MLSGLGDYKTLQEGYQLGARTFLLKPLNHDDIPQLLSKVRGLSVLTTDEGYVLAPSTELSPEQKTLQFA
jgi:YesN/AraC family two-component response regulator